MIFLIKFARNIQNMPQETDQMLLTKQQAIEAMKKGKKVAHSFFEPEEFIMLHDGLIHDEQGFCLEDPEEGLDFWKGRTGSQWESGWCIVPEDLFTA